MSAKKLCAALTLAILLVVHGLVCNRNHPHEKETPSGDPEAITLFEGASEATTPVVFAGVMSRASDVSRRDEIRRGLGAQLRDAGHQLVFVLSSEGCNVPRVREERSTVQDVFCAPRSVESYDDLTTKTRGLIALYVTKLTTTPGLVLLKCDDDVAFDVGMLEKELRRVDLSRGTKIWGMMTRDAPVDRRGASKWKTSLHEWPFPSYPLYPQGALYALSPSAASLVASSPLTATSHARQRLLIWEDIAVGLWAQMFRGHVLMEDMSSRFKEHLVAHSRHFGFGNRN